MWLALNGWVLVRRLRKRRLRVQLRTGLGMWSMDSRMDHPTIWVDVSRWVLGCLKGACFGRIIMLPFFAKSWVTTLTAWARSMSIEQPWTTYRCKGDFVQVFDVCMMVSVCFHKDLEYFEYLKIEGYFCFLWFHPSPFSPSKCHPWNKQRWRKYSPSCNNHPVPGAALCEVQRPARLGWFLEKIQDWTRLVRCVNLGTYCMYIDSEKKYIHIMHQTSLNIRAAI